MDFVNVKPRVFGPNTGAIASKAMQKRWVFALFAWRPAAVRGRIAPFLRFSPGGWGRSARSAIIAAFFCARRAEYVRVSKFKQRGKKW